MTGEGEDGLLFLLASIRWPANSFFRSSNCDRVVHVCVCVCVCVLVTQSCPTLCDPKDCSLPGSSVHGVFQARILEWAAIPSPEDLPNPGIEPGSPALQANSSRPR